MDDNLPAVSVCTTTYNSAKFIEEAICSVINQSASFCFEFIISDDCSTDETQAVIREYARKYPNIIRPIYQPQNIGLNANFMTAMKHCRGKYIALLDGDDYWSDPNKLQLQYDFLEDNPDIVLCGTASLRKHETTGTYTRSHAYLQPNSGEIKIFGTPEMYKLDPFWFPTHSLLLRSRFVDFPPWFKDVVYVDRALRLILSLHGNLAFINKITCVYRVHGSNVSSNLYTSPEVCGGYLHTYLNFYQYSGGKFKAEAKAAINHTLCEQRQRILEHGNGDRVIAKLVQNYLLAAKLFHISNIRSSAEFVYHFMFVKNIVAWFKRRAVN